MLLKFSATFLTVHAALYTLAALASSHNPVHDAADSPADALSDYDTLMQVRGDLMNPLSRSQMSLASPRASSLPVVRPTWTIFAAAQAVPPIPEPMEGDGDDDAEAEELPHNTSDSPEESEDPPDASPSPSPTDENNADADEKGTPPSDSPDASPSGALRSQGPASGSSVPKECSRLSQLFDDMGGNGWASWDQWKSSSSCCSWYGVTCKGSQVQALDLANNGLSGPLSPSLFLLPGLQRL